LETLVALFKNEKYLLNFSKEKIVVVLREGVEALDILKAYFNAYYLQNIITAQTSEGMDPHGLIQSSLNFTLNNFHIFMHHLEDQDWTTVHILLTTQDNRATW